MASVRHRGQRFIGLYRDASGAQKSAGTYDTYDEANARATVAELEARPPEPVEAHSKQKRGKITVAAYAPKWLEAQSLEPNTRSTYESSLKHIVKRLGSKTVAEVQTDDIRAIVRALKKQGLADATVRHIMVVAFLMFEAAARSKVREDNPCDGVKVKIRDQREMMTATREQAKAIEAAIPERYKLLVRALFATGCRWSEMIAVKGTDVERRGSGYVLKIRRTVNETWKVGLYEKPYGKSAKSTRDITIPEALALDLMNAGGKLCFANMIGGYLRRADFRRRAWMPAVKKAGVQGLRVHDTRHSHASWLANDPRVPLAAVRDRLGHTSLTTTSRYVHVIGDDPCLAALGEAA
jgi:integrase